MDVISHFLKILIAYLLELLGTLMSQATKLHKIYQFPSEENPSLRIDKIGSKKHKKLIHKITI